MSRASGRATSRWLCAAHRKVPAIASDDRAEQDFEAYVRANSAALARAAYLLTGDRSLAEDLLQESLAKVAGRWSALTRRGNPDAYVRRVMYNRSIDMWRRRRSRPETPTGDPGAWQELRGRTDEAETVVRRVVLLDALSALTPRQRAVLVLRFYEDLGESEAAAILGCSVNTVKSQTRYALRRLRELAPETLRTFDERQQAEAP
jgi:RNA polymerase sigma-70 factor (sigma-E family)